MESPDIYEANNHNQQAIAKEEIELFSNIVGKELAGTALDVGCGDGAVSVKVLSARYPRLRLVASDVSPAMLEHARRKYSQHDVDFMQLDITADLQIGQRYDYIFSFYCFHHFANQSKAVKNLYNLLNPGGSCLVVTVVNGLLYRITDFLSKSAKWSKYLSTVDNISPPFMNSKNPEGEFRHIFKVEGFEVLHTKVTTYPFVFEDLSSLLGLFKIVDYGRKFVPKDKLQMYHKDIDAIFVDYCTQYLNGKPCFYIDTLTMIARKST